MAKKSPKDVPQTRDTWMFGMRRLQTWINGEADGPFRPYMYLILNLDSGAILAAEIGREPTQQAVEELLFSAMTAPKKELKIRPQRPDRIFFEDRELARALAPILQEINVQAKYRHQPEIIDEVVDIFHSHMSEGKPTTPGLLSQKGVNPNLVSSLFAAAADFYRAEPWIDLANQDVLAVSVPPQDDPYYVIVMGQGGVEYGLSLYKSWQDVERQFGAHDYILDKISPEGSNALFFNEITEVPFDDLDAIELYGWEVADPQAYPVPMIFTTDGEALRPDRELLIWYEAAMRAIPRFVEEHLRLDEMGSLQPAEADIQVKTDDGTKKVHIKYPGGELSPELRAPLSENYPDEFELDELGLDEFDLPESPAFDRRAMEGDLAHMFGVSGAGKLDSKVLKAQDIMYDAWEESNPAKRISLARKALKVSADCADAYVLLAEEQAGNLKQSFELYQQGVEAGRRALGKKFFKENEGFFWGMVETRPFMRAMQGMALSLWGMNRNTEALEVFKEMLRLNPGDNQGMRYSLLELLLEMKREEEMRQLFAQYEDDWSAIWKYTQALLTFRTAGESKRANQALDEAFKQNSFVPAYLLGKKRLPVRLPETIGMGDETEAMDYASHYLNYWRKTPGALEWLGKQLEALGPLPSSDPAARIAQTKNKRSPKLGLQIGDAVAVNPGVKDPDYGDDLNGWQGNIIEITEDDRDEPLLLISWDTQTIASIPEETIKRSIQEGMDWTEMYLLEDEVTPAEERDADMFDERVEIIERREKDYAWLHLGEQGQRIQAVIRDVDPDDDWATFQAWDTHLRKNLELPFEAEVIEPQPARHLRMGAKVKVIAIQPLDEDEGVMVLVEKGKQQIEVNLYNLEVVDTESENYDLVDDYQVWFDES